MPKPIDLVIELEQEFGGSIINVPEDNFKLAVVREIYNMETRPTNRRVKRKRTKKQKINAKHYVLIDKQTGKRWTFNKLKDIGPAFGHSESWGTYLHKQQTQAYRVKLISKKSS